MTRDDEIRRDEACLDSGPGEVLLYPCHGQAGNQAWEYQGEEGSEMLMQGDKCLTLGNGDGRVKLTMERCEEGNGMQRWVMPDKDRGKDKDREKNCLLYTSPSPRDS